MIKAFKTTAIASAIAVTLAACGGGSTDTAGIGGSGFVSTGTITGFGSVYVNGVKFETGSATFDIEGDSIDKTQEHLAIGMVVNVNGTINPDGITGTATSIIFDDQLQGPVSGLTPATILATTTSATFTVLGTTVNIDRNLTYFDDATLTFDNIADNDNIEISGFFDNSGVLIASRIELKETFVVGSSIVEIKGNLLTPDDITYTLNGLNISISGITDTDDFPNGLSNNLLVEVEGTFDGINTITARKIESEELELEDSSEFELEGYITDFNSFSGDFKINGIPVNANDATLSPSTIILGNDLKVEAEGRIEEGKLIADELKLRGGDVKIAAYVSAINDDTFTVSPGDGLSAITIALGAETEMKDETNETESLNITHLSVGDFVEIEGFATGFDSVTAEQVKIVDFNETDGIEVQANIQETDDDGAITLLGVKFFIDGATVFKDSDDTSFTGSDPENEFNTAAISNPLISVTDSNSDGTAEKAEIE